MLVSKFLCRSLFSGERKHGACELVCKETLCSTRGEPVRRMTFRAPPDSVMNVNTALRQVILVRALGQLRMYSPTSTPAREDGTFDLIVRVYQNGLVSRWLDDVPVGGWVPMVWPWPALLRSDRRNPGRRVGLVAFGMGITESYRMAVQELRDPKVEEVVLLYATQVKEEQNILGPELQELLVEHPGRFRMEFTLTREEARGMRFGRVDQKMLAEVFPWADDESRDSARFVAAGTRQMISDLDSMLQGLGYNKESYPLIRDNTLAATMGWK